MKKTYFMLFIAFSINANYSKTIIDHSEQSPQGRVVRGMIFTLDSLSEDSKQLTIKDTVVYQTPFISHSDKIQFGDKTFSVMTTFESISSISWHLSKKEIKEAITTFESDNDTKKLIDSLSNIIKQEILRKFLPSANHHEPIIINYHFEQLMNIIIKATKNTKLEDQLIILFAKLNFAMKSVLSEIGLSFGDITKTFINKKNGERMTIHTLCAIDPSIYNLINKIDSENRSYRETLCYLTLNLCAYIECMNSTHSVDSTHSIVKTPTKLPDTPVKLVMHDSYGEVPNLFDPNGSRKIKIKSVNIEGIDGKFIQMELFSPLPE